MNTTVAAVIAVIAVVLFTVLVTVDLRRHRTDKAERDRMLDYIDRNYPT